MKRLWLALALVLVTACRPDYAIDLKDVVITKSPDGNFVGYIIVDNKSSVLMGKYGEVYIDAKPCNRDGKNSCNIGYINRHDRLELNGASRMEITFDNYDLSHGNEKDWVRPFKCFKIEAYQGYVGREGQSQWRCPAAMADRSVARPSS